VPGLARRQRKLELSTEEKQRFLTAKIASDGPTGSYAKG